MDGIILMLGGGMLSGICSAYLGKSCPILNIELFSAIPFFLELIGSGVAFLYYRKINMS
jgi:hypothetical protein